jgi:hypothetical protein
MRQSEKDLIHDLVQAMQKNPTDTFLADVLRWKSKYKIDTFSFKKLKKVIESNEPFLQLLGVTIAPGVFNTTANRDIDFVIWSPGLAITIKDEGKGVPLGLIVAKNGEVLLNTALDSSVDDSGGA